MKKALLILLLVAVSLMLTSCYTEQDPWPEANLTGVEATTPPVSTAVPATEPPATSVPATEEPLPEDAVDLSPQLNG